MNIQIIEIPAAAPPSSSGERETALRAHIEAGLLEPWMLDALLAQPLPMPSSEVLQLRDVLDRPDCIAIVGPGGARVTRDSQICVEPAGATAARPRTHRETGPIEVIGVRLDPRAPEAAPPRIETGEYAVRYGDVGWARLPVACGLAALPDLYPAERGVAALAIYAEAAPPIVVELHEAAPPRPASRWKAQLEGLGLVDAPEDMAAAYGFGPQLMWSELHGSWHPAIATIVGAARDAAAARRTKAAADAAAHLEAAVREHVRLRLFGGKEKLTAAEAESFEVEYAAQLAAARSNRTYPWADLLREMSPKLEQFFANNTARVQDWLRDADGYPIVCPHIWVLARRGDTLAIHKYLVDTYGVDSEVGSGIECRICGARIGLRDRIDYGEIAALAPDREQSELATRVGQFLRNWLEFAQAPDPASMRGIASGIYGAISPIVVEARKKLRAVATLGEAEFAQLYEFYSGVAIFAVLVKLIVDNPSRIFAKQVQRRHFVRDGEKPVAAPVDSDGEAAAAPVDSDGEIVDVEAPPKPPKPTKAPLKPTKKVRGGRDSDDDDDTDSSDDDNPAYLHGISGAAEQRSGSKKRNAVDTSAFATARRWALAAIEQEFRPMLAVLQDITPEVIANRFDSAYARVLAAIASAKVVAVARKDLVLSDPVADAIAASAKVRGPHTGPYWEAINALGGHGTARLDHTPLIGRLGTTLAVVEPKYDPKAARAAAAAAAAGRRGNLGYVYGDAAGRPPAASGIKAAARPHVHRWDVYAGAGGYGDEPHGAFSERYCDICGFAWSAAGSINGADAMDAYYDLVGFFNFYTSNCPVLPQGHVYDPKSDDHACKCGCTRKIISKRDPAYYTKYKATYGKLRVARIEKLPRIGLPSLNDTRRDKPSGAPVGVRAFAAATYPLYSIDHTELRSGQYEAICYRLGTSASRTWAEQIADAKAADPDTSPQRVAALRGHAQMLLVAASTIENYSNLAVVPADIEAAAREMSGKVPVTYHGRSYWEVLRGCRDDAARVEFLLDFIFTTIQGSVTNKKSGAAWVGYAMGKIIRNEREAARLSDDALAAINSRPGTRSRDEGGEGRAEDPDDEDDAEADFAGMDYDGENEKYS